MPTLVKQLPVNPYVTGGAVGNSPAFVGRDDVLGEVLHMLPHDKNNAIVLYGQRRIGKTSVLRELEARLPNQGDYIPIYFNLENKGQQSLGQLLQELARTIRDILQKNGLHNDQAGLETSPENTFHQSWLPQVLDQLPQNKSLVLLFDEFDVLDAPDAKQAGGAFFPYLRDHLLPLNPKRLNFVFVIGRKMDDMTQIALSVLRVTNAKRVSLLKREDTVKLIRLSEANKTLEWTAEAIDKVWQLTSGHPYLTQVLCSQLWHKLWDDMPASVPKVTGKDIQGNIIDETIDASESALVWLWDGLPPAERVVASALAEAGNRVIPEKQLEDLLTQSGVKLVIRELQTAPGLLQDWDLIEGTAKEGYRFRVELLRRWIAKYKRLSEVRKELDRLEPVADGLYQAGLGSYRAGNLEDALTYLRQADRLNPNHLAANQLLAEILLARNQPNEAREILERLYTYQPDVTTRPRLIQALLQSAQTSKEENEQIKFYERVLELDVNHSEVNQRFTEILAKKSVDKTREVLELWYGKNKHETAYSWLIKALLTQAQSTEDEDTKFEVYERLLEIDPKNSEAKQWLGQQRGKQAEVEGNLKVALSFYRQVSPDKAAEIEEKIQNLENFLDALVKDSKEVIATIFIHSLKTDQVLFHSQLDNPDSVAKWSLGDLKEISPMLNEFGNKINRGSLEYTVFQLTDSFLGLYFLTNFEVPIAVGFISAPDKGLGNIQLIETRIGQIKTKLSKILKGKNESV